MTTMNCQRRGVKLFAPIPMGGYKVDWENAPSTRAAWSKILFETWFNFKQNINKFAEKQRLYSPVHHSVFFQWDMDEIDKFTPMSSLGRELFMGMHNWIHNLKFMAWSRIDDPEYFDNFELLQSLFAQGKSDAMQVANDDQFKAAWADWIDNCKSTAKSVFEDFSKENEWKHEADVREEILKAKLAESAKFDTQDEAVRVPTTAAHAWQNPLEDSWAFRKIVWPRFPRSKFSKLTPYDVQILDPLFAKIQFLHKWSLKTDQVRNILNDFGLKLQNSFLHPNKNESAIALGIVEVYQTMVSELEASYKDKIWTEREFKFLKRKLNNEVLEEVHLLSDKGRFPSLKMLHPEIFL